MYKIIGVLLFACFLAAETRYTFPVKLEKNQNETNTAAETKISYRLPDPVEPQSYKIELTVFLDENEPKNFTFEGSVTIKLDVKKATKNITLHSQGLFIKKLNLYLNFPNEEVVEYSVENTTNFLTITKKSKDFAAGLYTLTILYEGQLNNDLRGFYRSHYMNGTEKVWLATTHFEPVGARRAIPCFDEPALKAEFEMTITHNKNLKAIFNTPVESSKNNTDDKTATTKFEKTPRMSTYLLAFVVSNFESAENSKKNFTVYARPNAKQFGNLAVEKGEQILQKLEQFTNIPFEMGKMDQIAIPQFTAGAMENWGLVTYREQSLLYDEKNSTTTQKQGIVETIAHEFAHQWFGDLVSPKWWKYLWLNEGFATFFQSYITEQVESTWRSVEQSVVNSGAFIVDSSEDTHPINHDVESPKEISQIFDTITYQKGGAVIRMMQHYLTDDIFKKGLQQYLNDFTHKAADSDDLFNSIQKVVDEKLNIKVKEVMDAWINKKGYPLVTVKRDYEKKTMNLTQERFFTYNASAEERKNNLWQIPLNYATESNPDFKNTSTRILFNKVNEIVPVDGAEKSHWIILNKQVTGFYRVNYDEENWKLIINYLNSTNREKIHPLNRAQLINDASVFVKEGILGSQILIGLTANLKNETDYIAWTSAFEAFSYLKSKLINTKYYPVFKEYAVLATAALVNSVGLEPTEKDDHIQKLTRIPAISLACSVGHSECLKKMNEILVAWLKDESKTIISKDLKDIVFCNGLRNSSDDVWNQVLNKSKSHTDLNEKKTMIRALSCTSEKKNLEYYLLYSMANPKELSVQMAMLNVLGNSEVGIDSVLDFIGQNIFMLHWQIDDKKQLTQLINILGAKITTEEQLTKLKALNNLSIKLPAELTAEAIRLAEKNLDWLQKNNETLTAEFIQERKNGVGTITSSIGLIASLLVILFYK